MRERISPGAEHSGHGVGRVDMRLYEAAHGVGHGSDGLDGDRHGDLRNAARGVAGQDEVEAFEATGEEEDAVERGGEVFEHVGVFAVSGWGWDGSL